MQIQRVHPHFAVAITGLAVSADMDQADIDRVRQVVDDEAVVVIRGQQAMTDDDQIAFSSRFGTLQKSITLHREDTERRMRRDELTEFATQPEFVYSHKWQEGDLVVWDNRTTMHRATPFPEDRYRRDMRRTNTEDDVVAIAA